MKKKFIEMTKEEKKKYEESLTTPFKLFVATAKEVTHGFLKVAKLMKMKVEDMRAGSIDYTKK